MPTHYDPSLSQIPLFPNQHQNYYAGQPFDQPQFGNIPVLQQPYGQPNQTSFEFEGQMEYH